MSDLRTEKASLRTNAKALRSAQSEKSKASRRILEQCTALPDWQRARTVLFYLDVRDEVRTQFSLQAVLQSGKVIAVPFCVGDRLELFHLECTTDLTPGRFGILEPASRLRSQPHRVVSPEAIDLALVPGVAFDRRGARLGHGAGFYDRLLTELRSDAVTVGLAYECQLQHHLPTEAHDVFLDYVVTEDTLYEGRGR